MKKKKGFTLIELLVAITLIGIIFPVFMTMVLFFLKKSLLSQNSANSFMQMQYTLEHVRMHCMTARLIDTGNTFDELRQVITLTPGPASNKFCFDGEPDIFHPDPFNTTTGFAKRYCYQMDTDLQNRPVLNFYKEGSKVETLIEGEFYPVISFVHTWRNMEPDFMEVRLRTTLIEDRNIGGNRTIEMFKGIPLWYTEVMD